MGLHIGYSRAGTIPHSMAQTQKGTMTLKKLNNKVLIEDREYHLFALIDPMGKTMIQSVNEGFIRNLLKKWT